MFWPLVQRRSLFFTCSAKSIVDFIDQQFEAYLQEELKVKRALHAYHDSRIHACLYFIAPTGHSFVPLTPLLLKSCPILWPLTCVVSRLKSLDLVTMKALDSKVNIIPVIAKADTITKQELQKFKTKVGHFRLTSVYYDDTTRYEGNVCCAVL